MVYWHEALVVDTTVCIRADVNGPSMSVDGFHEMTSVRGWTLHADLGGLDCMKDTMVTLFNYKVVSIDQSMAVLDRTDSSQALPHTGAQHFNQMVELCCGLGGMSLGATLAGFQVLAGVDVSQWALHVFEANHKATPIHGSISDPALIAHLFQQVGCSSVGFSVVSSTQELGLLWRAWT